MLKEHLLLCLGWILFSVLHSFLADHTLKKKLSQSSPRFFTYYRLFYTLFAFATFAAVVGYQVFLDSPLLYTSNVFLEIAGWIVAGTGVVIMFICIKKYFLSLSGLKSLFANAVVANELRIDGIHRYVRHPLYLGTFLAIWGAWIVYPFLSLLLSNVIITGYTLAGIVLEERKLVIEFGNDYLDYKKRVPTLLPRIKRPDSV